MTHPKSLQLLVKKTLGVGITTVVLLGGIAVSAGAVELTIFGRTITINGFIQQEAALGIDNSALKGKNITDYFSLQLEWEYRATENVSLHGINRLFGDMAYSLHHNSRWFKNATSTPAQSRRSRHNLEREWSTFDRGWETFRELYADILLGNFHFRAGRQQVIWGESDGLRLMDCINPLDMRREFNLRDSDEGYEYTRIPLWLLKVTWFPATLPPRINDLQVECIINPGKPRPNRLEAYGSEGGVWSAEEPNLPRGVRVELNDKTPVTSLKNSEFGLRLLGSAGGWLFTINGFYGIQQDPYLKPRMPSLVLPARDGRFLQLNFDRLYARRKIAGFTASRELARIKLAGTTAPVLRIEALYEFDKPFQYEGAHAGDMAWTGLNPRFESHKKFKDQIRMMTGLDWPVYLRFLNRRESFFFSAQFFLFYIRNKNGEYVNAPFYFTNRAARAVLPPLPPARDNRSIDPWRIHQTQKYVSFLASTYYDNKRIFPQVLYLCDLNEHAHGMKAKLAFAYGSHWRPEIGCMMWFGDHNTGKSFGLFQKNRQVYLKLKYQF